MLRCRYLGVFTGTFRERLICQWKSTLSSSTLNISPDYALASVVGDPVTIRAWNLAGLPRDVVSIDSAVIIALSGKWPLLIDPQGQANRWIRNMCYSSSNSSSNSSTSTSADFVVIRPSNRAFLKQTEIAVQLGRSVLIENVDQTLDAALDALLGKQLRKSGTGFVVRLGDVDVECVMLLIQHFIVTLVTWSRGAMSFMFVTLVAGTIARSSCTSPPNCPTRTIPPKFSAEFRL
jgi:dynein heavy chain